MLAGTPYSAIDLFQGLTVAEAYVPKKKMQTTKRVDFFIRKFDCLLMPTRSELFGFGSKTTTGSFCCKSNHTSKIFSKLEIFFLLSENMELHTVF